METIGIIVYCQGFLLPCPYHFTVSEMGLCDISGKHRKVFAYDNKNGPSYAKMSAEQQKSIDEQSEKHGVPYEPKYPRRADNCLTDDFDTFLAQFGAKDKSTVGVYKGDEVGQAFLTGLGHPSSIIEHADLQSLPLGTVLRMNEQYHNPECSGHWLCRCIDDDDSYMHRCSIEFTCALAALVRKEIKYRSPTILEDLLHQKNLWQYRMERLLDVLMCCSECQADMGRAFDRGEGLSWYSECDTHPCCFIRNIFDYGVYDPMPDSWNPSDYHDSTLDTLVVLTPPIELED